MFNYRLKSLMFVCGVATASAGVFYYLAWPIDHRYYLSFERTFKSLSLEEVIGPPGPSDSGTIKAEFDVTIDSTPPEIQTGDAFVLVLTATLKQVAFVPRVPSRTPRNTEAVPRFSDPMLAGSATPSPVFSPEQLRDLIHQRMKRGEIAFSLSLAGATVEPAGKNSVSENGRAQWSVKPAGPGLLRGFVKPDFLQSSGGHSGEYRVEYSAADYIPVDVTSTEPIVTTKSVLSGVMAFFGTLLTLPGILAFREEQRKKQKEQEEDQQRRTPKIIVPEGRRSDGK